MAQIPKKIPAADWLGGLNWEEYDDCTGSSASWYSDVKNKMNCDANPVITAARFKPTKIMKETMYKRWLFHPWKIMEQLSDT